MDTRKFNFLIKNIRVAKYFDILYDYFYRRIVFHLKYTYGVEFAQEVAQEFFIQLINRKSEKIHYVQYPTSWVYKCCENLAKRKISQEVTASELSSDFLLKKEQQYEVEIYGDLYDVIKALDADSQRILRMYYWEGYNFKEISNILQIKAGTIRQKHNRALKKIGKNLSQM